MSEAVGRLIVVSGPSGSGKSTLVRAVLDAGEFPLRFSVSATTRPPRGGETDGRDYHFVDDAQFDGLIADGDLLEWAIVHGNRYGTPRQPVRQALVAGRWLLLEIDTEGHRQIQQAMPEAVSFFVRPPSMAALERRLRDRATDSDEVILRRLADADAQMQAATSYNYQIVNDTLEQAVRTFRTLLHGVRALPTPPGDLHDRRTA